MIGAVAEVAPVVVDDDVVEAAFLRIVNSALRTCSPKLVPLTRMNWKM